MIDLGINAVAFYTIVGVQITNSFFYSSPKQQPILFHAKTLRNQDAKKSWRLGFNLRVFA
jgi:hypothetical protein